MQQNLLNKLPDELKFILAKYCDGLSLVNLCIALSEWAELFAKTEASIMKVHMNLILESQFDYWIIMYKMFVSSNIGFNMTILLIVLDTQ